MSTIYTRRLAGPKLLNPSGADVLFAVPAGRRYVVMSLGLVTSSAVGSGSAAVFVGDVAANLRLWRRVVTGDETYTVLEPRWVFDGGEIMTAQLGLTAPATYFHVHGYDFEL